MTELSEDDTGCNELSQDFGTAPRYTDNLTDSKPGCSYHYEVITVKEIGLVVQPLDMGRVNMFGAYGYRIIHTEYSPAGQLWSVLMELVRPR